MSMNDHILAGITFIAGAAISGTLTWLLTKNHYRRVHQEEMDAVWNDIRTNGAVRTINDKSESVKSSDDKKTIDETAVPNFEDKPDIMAYSNIVRDNGYVANYAGDPNDNIYEIEENELDEEEYKRIDLTYYADGVLADDMDCRINDIYPVVGNDFESIIRDKDEVFIRNENKKIDYDICKSMLDYGEMLERRPDVRQLVQYNDAVEDYYDNTNEKGDNYTG